ncbi:non-specific lipid transfer protein GPI-anchored 5-like [Salvia hispanica]|uniref:non-specific lipid transfer protein GPI-anchored 5-like n=1 Tax=Salvia hispanica TaxID=49212 RepID=UPI0020097AF9|nr:non-specific lipid transfer protein GPI-anchored 5-like [Salvia hispanica]
MDTKKCRFWSFLVIGLMVSTGCTAQSGCSNNMISGLSSCITYLRGNSTRPLPACCASLANIQQSQPECICPMLSNNGASATLGIAINRTLAMAMPATCKLTTPYCDDGPAASSPTISPTSDTSLVPPTKAPSADSDSNYSDSDSKTLPNIDTSYGNAATATTSSIYLTLMAAWIVTTCHF